MTEPSDRNEEQAAEVVVAWLGGHQPGDGHGLAQLRGHVAAALAAARADVEDSRG